MSLKIETKSYAQIHMERKRCQRLRNTMYKLENRPGALGISRFWTQLLRLLDGSDYCIQHIVALLTKPAYFVA